MRLRKEYILEIAATIWAMMLGLELQLGPDPAESGREDRTFAASTHIRGITNRTVSLLCPDGFARQATAVFFGVREEAVLPNQICDALGELTNMLGGNIDGLLAEHSVLSLPSVAVGMGYAGHSEHSIEILRLPMRCGRWPLVILIEQEQEQAC